MKSITCALMFAALATASTPRAYALDATQEAPSETSVSQGEIKKIDLAAGKLTIKHGELKNIHMGAMTMVFEVADKSILSQLKQGDAITFTADNSGGQLVARGVKLKK